MKDTMLIPALMLVGIASGALGMTGCIPEGQCAAACVGTATASGKLDMPPENPDLKVTMCVNDECAESQLTWSASGAAACQGVVDCDLTEGTDGATLKVQLIDFAGDMEVGDTIRVTVEVAATGDVLLDTTQEVEEVTEGEICGSTCYSAEVSWDQ